MVNRKSTAAVNAISFKSGDIVWVPYRKSPKWPAVIKNVYPKKLTYCFLPESERPATFKASPKVVALFKETDTLPEDAQEDLQAAYDAAIKLVRGETTLKYLAPTPVKGKRSPSSSPSTSNNSLDEPVPAKKARLTNESIAANTEEFSRMTVVLVDKAETKKFPALLTDVSDRNLIVRHFPLIENQNSTSYPYSRVHNVTYDDIGELIASQDCKAPEYVRALVAAEEFIERPADYIEVPAGFVFTQKAPEVRGTRKSDEKEVLSESQTRPKAKAVFKTTRASTAAAAARNSTASAQNSSNNSIDTMTRSPSVVKNTTKSAKKVAKKEVKNEDNANATNSNGLNIGALSLCPSMNQLLRIMISFEAREYMENIWNKKISSTRNTTYKRVEKSVDAHLSFYIGELLEFKDIEHAISEMRKWIKLSPKVPRMSIFTELHYIANVILPEIVVFALQKLRNITAAEAEDVLNNAINNKSMGNVPEPQPDVEIDVNELVDVTTYEEDLPEEGGSSFERLLRAVSIEREAKNV